MPDLQSQSLSDIVDPLDTLEPELVFSCLRNPRGLDALLDGMLENEWFRDLNQRR